MNNTKEVASLLIVACVGAIAVLGVAMVFNKVLLKNQNINQSITEPSTLSNFELIDVSHEIVPNIGNSGLDSYQNEKLGFKISYPSGWNIASYNLFFKAGEVVNTRTTATIFFPGSPPNTTDKLTLFSIYSKAPITVMVFDRPIKTFQDITVGWQETKVQGKKAVTKTQETGRLIYYIEKDQNSTISLMFDPRTDGDSNLFSKILASFRIL